VHKSFEQDKNENNDNNTDKLFLIKLSYQTSPTSYILKIMYTLPDLPVSPYLPQIAETLKNSPSRFLILTAETGAGKSTVIPAGLHEYFPGKILMTEPRRIAALSIAERVSEILEEPCGKTCGYKIHLENKTSKETKIEVVTEAVLSRTLQNDPSLDGYSVILIDEFHERSVTTDLNLAFLREAMELRDDLFVIIMSATIETEKLAGYLNGENLQKGQGQTGYLGGENLQRGQGQTEYLGHENLQRGQSQVPVMEIPGRTFPVEVEYKPECSLVKAVLEELGGQTPAYPVQKSKVILAFLPGIKEIRRAESDLREALAGSRNSETEIHVLHSSVSLADQKKIFAPLPAGTNRVIISSAIAETSLTVPGVTTVIDSGISRINKMNLALGMETLVTEAESEFSSEQRKGRAGRLQEGRCVRLWSKNEPRQKTMPPEILRTDISSIVLECAAWGKNLSEAENFFLDSPSPAAVKTSTEFLQNMNFLDSENKITNRGRLALEAGVSPRLANLVIFAAENPSLKNDAVNLILKYSNYADSNREMQKRFCDDIQDKITRAGNSLSVRNTLTSGNTASKTELLFAGFSDRLAKKQPQSQAAGSLPQQHISYQFPNGHTAFLSKDLTYSQAPEWLIAPEVLATASGGTIFDYEPLTENEALSLIQNLLTEETECSFNENQTKINKIQYTKYGRIILSEKRLNVSKEDSTRAWCTQIRKKGLNSLNLSDKMQNFLIRAQFYQDHKEENSSETKSVISRLETNPEEWLSPFLTDSRLTDETLYNAAYWFLDGSSIDANVPTQIILSNGRKARVTYELNSSQEDKTKLIVRPVIEIIIQRIFGCFENPQIMKQPVLLKLLSPASRPLQITDDLAGFWSGTWIEICKEMKGRYPKHNWDYRIAEKE